MHPFEKKTATLRGLTLIETIVVTALFALLMLAVTTSISSFYSYNAYTVSQSYQVMNARRGVELLIRDVREMTYADDGTFPLARMEDDLVGFYSDINDDDDDGVEYVEYELIGSTLQKRVYHATGSPPTYPEAPDETRTLSEYVQNNAQNVAIFTYYDESGSEATATSTVTDVRYISTQVIVNIDPVRDPGEFMLRGSAALRNLKENL